MSNDPYAIGSVDPYKLATQQRSLIGSCAVVNMVRAARSLVTNQGELGYKLAFAMDEDNVCVVSGTMHGLVQLSCQRCLQPFAYNVKCEFEVSPVVNDDAAKSLPESYEPVMLFDGKLNLLELLEDELILALPQVPMHDIGDGSAHECAPKHKNYEEQDFDSPFEVLQELKLKKGAPEMDRNSGGKNGSTAE